MWSAVRSFVVVTSALVITSAAAWFYVFQTGHKQAPHPFANPFFASASKAALVAHRGCVIERPENTFAAFDFASGLGSSVILWADVQVAADGTLVIFRDKDTSSTTDGTGWIPYMKAGDIAKLDAGYMFTDAQGAHPFRGKGLHVPVLKDFIARYPKRRLALNFMQYAPGMDDRIVALARSLNAGQRILFMSDADGLTKDLRERAPEWIYGTSEAQTTRFLMLGAIGLASAAKLRADIYVTRPRPFSRLGRSSAPIIDSASIEELQRRGVPVLAGPVRDANEARELVDAGVAGIISDEPSALTFLY